MTAQGCTRLVPSATYRVGGTVHIGEFCRSVTSAEPPDGSTR